MIKQKRSKPSSSIFLILGLAFLIIGISTGQTFFSWIAVGLMLASLLAGGRWMRPRRK